VGFDQKSIVLDSLGSAMVRILFEAISWTPIALAGTLTLTLGLRAGGAKRRYEAHFVSKLTDADGLRLVAYASESENGETETWLDFACDCLYLSKAQHAILIRECGEVGAMLGSMVNAPTSFIVKPSDL